jgi:hypothetical protein
MVCHNGNTLCIKQADVADHLNQGDKLGACAGSLTQAKATGEINEMPNGFILENYPNPFNGSTTIRYSLPDANESYHVLLKVFDATGKEIKTLANDEEAAGWKTISFDAGHLPPEVYFYRLSAGTFNEVRKLILIK